MKRRTEKRTKPAIKEKRKVAEQPALNKEIRRAVDTGKVVFGKKQSEKSILNGETELIVLSNNAPEMEKDRVKHLCGLSSVPMLEFQGTGIELGSVCGKPFTVSIMGIQKAGKSKILSAAK